MMFGTDLEMLERTPGHEHFPANMLPLMRDAIGGSLDDIPAGDATRSIGLAEDDSGAVRRLTRFHAPGSAGRQLVDEFRAIARGESVRPLRW